MANRLQGILREVEKPLSESIREHTAPDLDIDEWRLVLMRSHCGLATAALQRYLHYFGISTRRIARTWLDDAPVSFAETHVILTTYQEIIDPTYLQTLEAAGYSASLSDHFPHLLNMTPVERIAVPNTHEFKLFGNQMGRLAVSARQEVSRLCELSEAPSDDAQYALIGAERVLSKGVSAQDLVTFYEDVWNVDRYTPYVVSQQSKRAPYDLSDGGDDEALVSDQAELIFRDLL